MRHANITSYLQPLREGGSLPALVEADDGFLYVVKFRGAGHGVRALISELLGGEIARALGLNVPELVFLTLPEPYSITEPDQEVQDLLKASTGLNIGLHFLSGALTMDAYKNPVDALTASLIVWLDAFITNVDRTARNTNILQWHERETWLIDHGASFMFHHSWTDYNKSAQSPFQYIKSHALLHKASKLDEADSIAHKLLTPEIIDNIVSLLPDEWLVEMNLPLTPEEIRTVYSNFLKTRFSNSQTFLTEAKNARQSLI